MTRVLTVAAFLVLLATQAAAQPVRVDHRDPAYPAGFFDTLQIGTPVVGSPGWTWQHDGTGWLQATTTPVPPPADECRDVDPYLEPERAVRCNAQPEPGEEVPVFLVGHVYALGYDEVRAVVLGLTSDVDGVQVVTVRWLSGAGGVEARRTPPTPGGSTSWHYVGRLVP